MNTKRTRAVDLLGFGAVGAPARLTDQQRAELEACRRSFRHFLNYWHFRDRETGEIRQFIDLWPGQARLAELMARAPWIFALKAGKLGFTELACAYDGWVVALGQKNARVHLFSREANAAAEILSYVRFGLDRLPSWMRLPIAHDELGADTTMSLKFRAGLDDVRAVVAYPAGPNVSIEQSATHCHIDELAHMAFPERTWNAVETTVAPHGSCHIVTRGAGDANYTAELWDLAQTGASRLTPFFAAYHERPDRDAVWRDSHATTLNQQGLLHFLPETPEDALAGDETAIYIPIQVWDSRHDETLPPLEPGDRDPVVLGVDAAVRSDCTAIVAVTRHPRDSTRVAVRAVKVFKPEQFGGTIDFLVIENFIRLLYSGGCRFRHPRSRPDPTCNFCSSGNFELPRHNVVQIVYDPFQMEAIAQTIRRECGVWCYPFDQGEDRLRADAALYTRVMRGDFVHNGDPTLREHVLNARAKIARDEDTKMRIIKAAPSRKIDAIVATSMAVHECMRLMF